MDSGGDSEENTAAPGMNNDGHDHTPPVAPERVLEILRHHPSLDYLMVETILVHKDRGTLHEYLHLLGPSTSSGSEREREE